MQGLAGPDNANDGVTSTFASRGLKATAPRPDSTVQRVAGVDDAAEAATLTQVLMNCITGALGTIVLDELIQVGSWLWKGGKFRQNWCKTLISALGGCIFGVAGGAFERMFLMDGAAKTTSGILQWLIRKAQAAGYTAVAGKLGLIVAKAGCDQANDAVSDSSPDTSDQNQQVTQADQTSPDASGADSNQAPDSPEPQEDNQEQAA
ncbi:MAG: hypothetical protein ACJ74Y_12185 [Bryobacteraceae bacterium]